VRELLHLYLSLPYLCYLCLSLASGGAAHVAYNNLLLKNMGNARGCNCRRSGG
jgi:hypothetical protein